MKKLKGPIGDDLIDVHVEGCAGPSLEGIDDDVFIELTVAHFGACAEDGVDFFGVVFPCAEVFGSRCTGELDVAHGVYPGFVDVASRDLEVVEASCGVDAPEGICGDAEFADEIVFCSVFHVKKILIVERRAVFRLIPQAPFPIREGGVSKQTSCAEALFWRPCVHHGKWVGAKTRQV